MKTWFEISNNWNDCRLSESGEWRNDGDNCMFKTLAKAKAQACLEIRSCEDFNTLYISKIVWDEGEIENKPIFEMSGTQREN